MIDFRKTVKRTFKGPHLFSLVLSEIDFEDLNKPKKIIVKTKIQEICQGFNLKFFRPRVTQKRILARHQNE